MEKIGEGLKKVILAGVGAVALTGEKTSEVLGTLVEKGELTVEQGKVLNEELKHTVKEKLKEASDKIETEEPELDEEAKTKKEISEILNGMKAEQLEQLKALLAVVTPAKEEEEPEEEIEITED